MYLLTRLQSSYNLLLTLTQIISSQTALGLFEAADKLMFLSFKFLKLKYSTKPLLLVLLLFPQYIIIYNNVIRIPSTKLNHADGRAPNYKQL